MKEATGGHGREAKNNRERKGGGEKNEAWRKSEDAGIGRKHCGGEERGVEERRVLEWESGTGCEIRVTRVMI